MESVIRDAFKEAVSPDPPEEAPAAAEEPVAETTETKTETKVETPGPVPYERFTEVNNRAKDYEQQLAQLRPLVEAHQSVINHCQQYGITPEKFSYWMGIAALDESDPIKAREALAPKIQSYQALTGEVIAPDLQKAVDEGSLSLDYARELTKARGATQLAQQNQARQAQTWQTQQQQRLVREYEQTMETWVANKTKLMPEFKPKADPNAKDGSFEFFLKMFETEVKNAGIRAPADIVKVADQVLASLNDFKQSGIPRPAAQKGIRSSTSTAAVKAKPQTLEEVVRNRYAELTRV